MEEHCSWGRNQIIPEIQKVTLTTASLYISLFGRTIFSLVKILIFKVNIKVNNKGFNAHAKTKKKNCCSMVHVYWHYINIHWGQCTRYLLNLDISYVKRLTSNNTECSLSHFLTICNFTEANKCSNCPNVYLWLIPLPPYNNSFSPFPKVTVFSTVSEIFS